MGLALPNLAALLEGYGAGQARDVGPVAPARLQQILALALKIARCRTGGCESRATVGRYMIQRQRPASPTWRLPAQPDGWYRGYRHVCPHCRFSACCT